MRNKTGKNSFLYAKKKFGFTIAVKIFEETAKKKTDIHWGYFKYWYVKGLQTNDIRLDLLGEQVDGWFGWLGYFNQFN